MSRRMRCGAESALLAVAIAVALAIYMLVGPIAGTAAVVILAVTVIAMVWGALGATPGESSVIPHGSVATTGQAERAVAGYCDEAQ